LRVEYPSVDVFKVTYSRGVKLMDYAIQKIRELNINLEDFIPEQTDDVVPRGEIFLILKYTANYKAPMRAMYEYLRWFWDRLHEGITFEEVEDGFLHFYQQRENFQFTLLDPLNPGDFQTILQKKNIHLPNGFLQEVLSFLPGAE
jgi:hypothetical protein